MWGCIAWIVSTLLFYSVANSDHAFSKSILQNSRAPTSGSSLTKSSLLSIQIMSIWMKQKGKFKQVSKLLVTCICGHCSDYMIHTSIFEACLKEHKKHCPPKKTKCGASTQSMPGVKTMSNSGLLSGYSSHIAALQLNSGPRHAHTLQLSATLCISLHPVITTLPHLPCCTVNSPCSIYIFYLVVFSLDLTYFCRT